MKRAKRPLTGVDAVRVFDLVAKYESNENLTESTKSKNNEPKRTEGSKDAIRKGYISGSDDIDKTNQVHRFDGVVLRSHSSDEPPLKENKVSKNKSTETEEPENVSHKKSEDDQHVKQENILNVNDREDKTIRSIKKEIKTEKTILRRTEPPIVKNVTGPKNSGRQTTKDYIRRKEERMFDDEHHDQLADLGEIDVKIGRIVEENLEMRITLPDTYPSGMCYVAKPIFKSTQSEDSWPISSLLVNVEKLSRITPESSVWDSVWKEDVKELSLPEKNLKPERRKHSGFNAKQNGVRKQENPSEQPVKIVILPVIVSHEIYGEEFMEIEDYENCLVKGIAKVNERVQRIEKESEQESEISEIQAYENRDSAISDDRESYASSVIYEEIGNNPENSEHLRIRVSGADIILCDPDEGEASDEVGFEPQINEFAKELNATLIKEEKFDTRIPVVNEISGGPHKGLWQQLPEVIESGVLASLNEKDIKLTESVYEIITTENSYAAGLKNLVDNILKKVYLKVPYVIKQSDYDAIFPVATLQSILAASLKLLEELTKVRMEDTIRLRQLSKVFVNHYLRCKDLYVKYSANFGTNLKKFKDLRKNNLIFDSFVSGLKNERSSNRLDLEAFLILPVQRVTRLPLLLRNVISNTNVYSDDFLEHVVSYKELLKIVSDCNDAAQQMETALELEKELRSPRKDEVKQTLYKTSRMLKLRASAREMQSLQKSDKSKIEVFLFNDLFLVCRREKKNDETLLITDCCPKECLVYTTGTKRGVANVIITIFHFKMKMNVRRKVDMLVKFDNEEEGHKFQELFSVETDKSNRKEVVVIHVPREVDLTSLDVKVGDIIVVSQERDGWYFGERLQDQATGCIPSTCCREIIATPQ